MSIHKVEELEKDCQGSKLAHVQYNVDKHHGCLQENKKNKKKGTQKTVREVMAAPAIRAGRHCPRSSRLACMVVVIFKRALVDS